MSPQIITLIIVLAICVAAFILLYFQGKRNMKKRDEQQAAIDQAAQWVNMLIIDKKKLRMKQSGLPQQVIDQTPKFARLAKVPVVKAKVGPQIMVLIADNQIYDQIPVKKEVKKIMSLEKKYLGESFNYAGSDYKGKIFTGDFETEYNNFLKELDNAGIDKVLEYLNNR